ncbi:aldo/keto reductase [Candidatus Poribacteria bacterium]|nr:MAG: aldo/keto reductase [Candidatus Poribacteria bacterium]
MEYTHLGRIGLRVSRLCLGTVSFGRHTSQEESLAILDHALQAGINFFDTSNSYNEGLTETIVGNWLSQDKSRRDQIVLATKVYSQMGEGPNDARLSAYHIRRACENSLRRLQTDHIDLYQMHHVDRRTPWDEIWQAMEQLVREGKISYVGSSNFAAWHIVQAQGIATQRNFLGLVSEQSVYNLRSRAVELEVLPCCRELGLAVIPYSPMGSGLLCGILDNPTTGRRGREVLRDVIKTHRPQLQAYEALCASIGHSPANVALAWVLNSPNITAPIIGARTVEQFEDTVAVLELKLDNEILAKLDEIWPGPGGEAPEAYAW